MTPPLTNDERSKGGQRAAESLGVRGRKRRAKAGAAARWNAADPTSLWAEDSDREGFPVQAVDAKWLREYLRSGGRHPHWRRLFVTAPRRAFRPKDVVAAFDIQPLDCGGCYMTPCEFQPNGRNPALDSL